MAPETKIIASGWRSAAPHVPCGSAFASWRRGSRSRGRAHLSSPAGRSRSGLSSIGAHGLALMRALRVSLPPRASAQDSGDEKPRSGYLRHRLAIGPKLAEEAAAPPVDDVFNPEWQQAREQFRLKLAGEQLRVPAPPGYAADRPEAEVARTVKRTLNVRNQWHSNIKYALPGRLRPGSVPTI